MQAKARRFLHDGVREISSRSFRRTDFIVSLYMYIFYCLRAKTRFFFYLFERKKIRTRDAYENKNIYIFSSFTSAAYSPSTSPLWKWRANVKKIIQQKPELCLSGFLAINSHPSRYHISHYSLEENHEMNLRRSGKSGEGGGGRERRRKERERIKWITDDPRLAREGLHSKLLAIFIFHKIPNLFRINLTPHKN